MESKPSEKKLPPAQEEGPQQLEAAPVELPPKDDHVEEKKLEPLMSVSNNDVEKRKEDGAAAPVPSEEGPKIAEAEQVKTDENIKTEVAPVDAHKAEEQPPPEAELIEVGAE